MSFSGREVLPKEAAAALDLVRKSWYLNDRNATETAGLRRRRAAPQASWLCNLSFDFAGDILDAFTISCW
jgi:hypothetical protein